MEYYSTLKRKGILTHATIGMNLDDMMLSEISQTRKGKYCVVPLTEAPWRSQTPRGRKQNRGYQGLGRQGMKSYCLMGTDFLFGKMKTFCKWIVMMFV